MKVCQHARVMQTHEASHLEGACQGMLFCLDRRLIARTLDTVAEATHLGFSLAPVRVVT